MEPWLVLGILAYLSFSISTAIDKFVMDKGYSALGTNTLKMFFDGIILLAIGLVFFELNITLEQMFWALVLGGIFAVSGIVYFLTLKLEDVEIVVPFRQAATLLLVFSGSIILFNETTSLTNYLGLAMVLIGMYALLSEGKFKLPNINKAFFMVLALVAVNTVYSLLTKSLLFDIQPIALAIIMYFSGTLISGIYLSLFRKEALPKLKKIPKIFAAAIFGALGTLFLFYALSIGHASKIYAMEGLMSIFIFIIAITFLKQKLFWHRLLGVILIFAGILLVSI